MTTKHWETTVCDLCQSADYQVLWKDLTYWEYPGVFQVVKCKKCQLVFLNPRPKIDEIAKYYIQENYFGRDISESTQEHDDLQERENTYKNIYAILLKSKKGKILDIGAGTGLFLSKFKDLGWEVDGVEINPDAVIYAKKHYAIKMKEGDFFDFRFKENTYDIITLNGALEHLYNPQETLKRAYTLLKKNGVILFTVPNVASLGNVIFGRNWFPWQPPRHLYHFSPQTATKMLQAAKFKKIQVKHNYWLQNYYILFQSLRYSRSPKFKTKKTGGLAETNYKKTFSLKKEIGKIGGKIFAFSLSMIEPMLEKGEVLIVYAKK